jgi:hypothetical protein
VVDDLLDALPLNEEPEAAAAPPRTIAEVIDRAFAFLPSVTTALDVIEDAIEEVGQVKYPGGVLITGAGGTGKSAILDQVLRRHPTKKMRLELISPALYLKFDVRLSVPTFLRAILAALDHPCTSADPMLQDTVVAALKACQVKALLLDEVHHLLLVRSERRSETRQTGDVGDTIKSIADKVGLVCVMAGLPGLSKALAADSQFESRWPARITLENMACDAHFTAMLNVFDCALQQRGFFTLCPGFAEGHIPRDVHRITQGNLRVLKMLVRRTATIAAREGSKFITSEHVKRAAVRIFGQRNSL